MTHSRSGVVFLMSALAGWAPGASAAVSDDAAHDAQATPTRTLPAARARSDDDRDFVLPTLRSFSVRAPANLAAPGAQIVLDMKASDDYSGVESVVFDLIGPSGKSLLSGAGEIKLPALAYESRGGIDVSAYTEPGIWTVTRVIVTDFSGNRAFYDTEQLKSLGNVTVNLVTSRPDLTDVSPPSVVGGVVLTPVASISALMPGTVEPYWIGADFRIVDDTSGAFLADATWCVLPAGVSCINSSAYTSYRKGGRNWVAHVWRPLSPSDSPGTYTLQSMTLHDHAGNSATLVSTEFGGTMDFPSIMPKGRTITLTP